MPGVVPGMMLVVSLGQLVHEHTNRAKAAVEKSALKGCTFERGV
jgi:hypothetical protein